MRSFRLMALLAMCLMLLAAPVQAKTTITFWHGMGGELGEITDEMIKEFNASQDKYEVKGVYKGNYDEAMTAAIAAFRAKQHPNLIQIFEVGTASMMAAKGAIRPVYEIMEAAGTPVDTSKLLGSVASYYSSTDGKLIAMPFNASTTVLYYNKDAVKKAGGDPDHFPTTWPEVAELAKKIKESGACKYGLTSGWQSCSLKASPRGTTSPSPPTTTATTASTRSSCSTAPCTSSTSTSCPSSRRTA